MTTDQADALVAISKFVPEEIVWKERTHNPHSYRFKVTVFGGELDANLSLVGTLGPISWSFVLLVDNRIKIRRISAPKNPHMNPDGVEVDPKHKHRWTTEHEDRVVYVPGDIRWTNHYTVLMDFAAECNIDLQWPPKILKVQGRLL